jgi:ADP-ribose diphosphatase
MKPWKRIEPTTIHRVGWRTVVSKTFIDNKGQQHLFDTYCKEGQEFVAVLALTPDNQVVVTRQFRVGPEKVMDELPGGFVDAGEDKEAALRRELLEETGYQAGNVEYLGPHHKDTYMNAVWHFFYATDCILQKEQALEHEEDIEVRLISIPELYDNALHDKMTDPIVVLFAHEKLRKLQETT